MTGDMHLLPSSAPGNRPPPAATTSNGACHHETTSNNHSTSTITHARLGQIRRRIYPKVDFNEHQQGLNSANTNNQHHHNHPMQHHQQQQLSAVAAYQHDQHQQQQIVANLPAVTIKQHQQHHPMQHQQQLFVVAANHHHQHHPMQNYQQELSVVAANQHHQHHPMQQQIVAVAANQHLALKTNKHQQQHPMQHHQQQQQQLSAAAANRRVITNNNNVGGGGGNARRSYCRRPGTCGTSSDGNFSCPCAANMAYLDMFPPGYRFSPKDEELLTNYLLKKINNEELPPNKILEMDIYRDCPEAITAGQPQASEGEWYFFTPRNKKYANGSRPNRKAGRGYWKATGPGNKIPYDNGNKIGSRRSLVYHAGKPPHGVKTDWIMQEYVEYVDTDDERQKIDQNDMKLNDHVLCKIYKKNERGRKRPRMDADDADQQERTRVVQNRNQNQLVFVAENNYVVEQNPNPSNQYGQDHQYMMMINPGCVQLIPQQFSIMQPAAASSTSPNSFMQPMTSTSPNYVQVPVDDHITRSDDDDGIGFLPESLDMPGSLEDEYGDISCLLSNDDDGGHNSIDYESQNHSSDSTNNIEAQNHSSDSTNNEEEQKHSSDSTNNEVQKDNSDSTNLEAQKAEVKTESQ